MERIEAGREAIVFILEGFYVLVSQIAADEQLLADGQFQSGAVEKRTGELIAEVEEMRTATEDGIEQFVLEAGCKVQFRGVAAEKHHLYFGVRVGIDQSQLETVQLLLVVVYQTYLKAFGTDGYIQGESCTPADVPPVILPRPAI